MSKESTLTERMVERIAYGIVMALLAFFAAGQQQRAEEKMERAVRAEEQRFRDLESYRQYIVEVMSECDCTEGE